MMTSGHILGAAAVALMLGAPGIVSAQQSATATVQATAPQARAAGYRKLDDMNVVTPAGDKIGEVEEVLMNASGQIVAVAVELGGFLGFGDRDVIVGLDQLRFESDRFVTTLTKEQLGALPKWD